MKKLKASVTPLLDIEKVAYSGQPDKMKQFRSGHNQFLESIPVIELSDSPLQIKNKLFLVDETMSNLNDKLSKDTWVTENRPGKNEFDRIILAIEDTCEDNRTSVELILARWGDNFTSPIHGHSFGIHHETVINGMVRVNSYELVGDTDKVRLKETKVVKPGLLISKYSAPVNGRFKRPLHIHNFISIGNSETLHYIPEHSRDGMDNTFEVEYFEDKNTLNVDDVTRVTSLQAMYLPIGEVVMVRSTNVPEYADHFIIITGKPTMKEHGLRPQDIAIAASPNGYSLLDLYEPMTGLILLQLSPEKRDDFLAFHGYYEYMPQSTLKPTDFEQMTTHQARGIKAGDVVLVRHDHNEGLSHYFSIIGDGMVSGFSPKIKGNIIIPADERSRGILSSFPHKDGITILKMNRIKAEKFKARQLTTITEAQFVNGEYNEK